MKMTMMISLVFGCLMFSVNSFAESELNKIIEKKKPNQSTTKKSRRKKVEMCVDCGKPETECDCPGYEHNSGKDHNHEHDKTKKNEEKK